MALIGLATSANAQNLTFGIKGGLNHTINIHVDDIKAPFHAGVFAEWRFDGFLAVAPELVYLQQGAQLIFYSCDGTTGDVIPYDYASTRLSYINVPVLAKFYPVKWLSVDFGPQAGFLVAARTGNITKNNIATQTTNSKNSFNGVDLSLGMGLTVNFSKHVFMQGRYNMGLTQVTKKTTLPCGIWSWSGNQLVRYSLIGNKKYTNNIIQVGLGYRFGS